MKIIIPPIYEREDVEITLDEYDFFNRKKFIANLTKLLQNTSDGLVITIDSQWGEGKTTLLKVWEKTLSQDDQFVPIYYDAFKNDFSEDVFLSIAIEIHEALKSEILKSGHNPKSKEQLATLKKHAVEITVESLKVLTQASSGAILSSWGLPNSISKSFSKLINNLLFGTLEHKAEEKFKAHLRLKKNIHAYKAKLREILSSQENATERKIVFFVDELDRCRPNFAIEVIEKIKHLFSTENVFFILAINSQQLIDILRHSYGINASHAKVYLQKFVHIETKLPALDRTTSNKDTLNVKIGKFVDQLIELHEIENFFSGSNHIKIAVINLLATFKNPLVTPRSIERVFSLIAIALCSSEGSVRNDSQTFNALCNMAVLKVLAPQLYERWKGGEFINENNYTLEEDIFHQLEKNFPNKTTGEDNNKFIVKKIEYVSGILDIYTFYKTVSNSVTMSLKG